MEQTRRLATSDPIFGSLLLMNPQLFAYSTLIIIGAINCFEFVHHFVHLMTHDTKFSQNVRTIEIELMIVGCTAFFFKVLIFNTSFLPPDWFHALEVADIMIPIFSISQCFIGMLLVFLSVQVNRSYNVAVRKKLHEILDGFYQASQGILGFFTSENAQLEFRMLRVIFSEKFHIGRDSFAFQTYMELVLDSMIRDFIQIEIQQWAVLVVIALLYMTRKDALYVLMYQNCNKYFEEESASTYPETNDHANDDHSLLQSSVLNYMNSMIDTPKTDFKSASYSRYLAAAGDTGPDEDLLHCIAQQQIQNFVIGGLMLLFITIFFAVLSRYYIWRLIQTQTGVQTRFDYPQFLEDKEAVEDAARPEVSTKDKESLFSALQNTNIQKIPGASAAPTPAKDAHDRSAHHKKLSKALRVAKEREEMKKDMLNNVTDRVNDSFQDLYDVCFSRNQAQVYVEASQIGPSPELRDEEQGKSGYGEEDSGKSAASNSTDVKLQEKSLLASKVPLKENDKDSDDSGAFSPNINPRRLSSHAKREKRKSITQFLEHIDDDNVLSAAEEVDEVYDVNKPQPEKAVIATVLKAKHKFLTGLKSRMEKKENKEADRHDKLLKNDFSDLFFLKSPNLYLTLVRFLMMFHSFYYSLLFTNFSGYEVSALWQFFSFLIILTSTFVYIYVVNCAATLRAIWQVEYDALVTTIGDEEESKQLFESIQEKLLAKCACLGDNPREDLKALFDSIDDNGNEKLSRLEFKLFLNDLGIHFNGRKWNHIFQTVDLNCDNEISLNEFILFLYPEDTTANKNEKERLKTIRIRARRESVKISSKNKNRKRLKSENEMENLEEEQEKDTFSNAPEISSTVAPLDTTTDAFPGDVAVHTVHNNIDSDDDSLTQLA